MDNPYKAPEAHVADLTLTELPPPLKSILKLFWLAVGLSVAQLVISFVYEPDLLIIDDEFSLALMLIMVLLILLIYFLVYYLCLFRPVNKRKAGAAKWWFWTALIMSALSLATEFFLEGGETSLAEKVLNVMEMLVLFYGAYQLSLPLYKSHLTK